MTRSGVEFPLSEIQVLARLCAVVGCSVGILPDLLEESGERSPFLRPDSTIPCLRSCAVATRGGWLCKEGLDAGKNSSRLVDCAEAGTAGAAVVAATSATERTEPMRLMAVTDRKKRERGHPCSCS